MKDLHPTQKELLRLLVENVENPLTMRELSERLSIATPSVIYHHVAQLEKKGFLKRDPNNPANYQILADEPEKQIAYLNSYGAAHCGPNGSILDGTPEERIAISPRLLSYPTREAFLVRARGDSMTPGINNGDYVIARRMTEAKHGRVMVCVDNGEVKIKRIDIGQDDQIWLVSTNNTPPENAPRRASGDFRVEGLVTGILFRRF